MTVRLLVQYGKFPPNTNFSGGESVEGMLLRTGQADTNTAAGVAWVDPVPTELSGPTSISSSGGTDLLLADGRELLDLTAARSLVSGAGDFTGLPAMVTAIGWDEATWPVSISVDTRDPGFPKGDAGLSLRQCLDINHPGWTSWATLWVDLGAGSNGTGTEGSPFNQLFSAVAAATAGGNSGYIIRVKGSATAVPRTRNFSNGGATKPTCHLVWVFYGGNSTIGSHGPLTWAADGTYAWCSTVARSSGACVVDLLNKTPQGTYVELRKVTSAAICSRTPNSWWTDNTNILVNRGDGEAATDTNTRAYLAVANALLDGNTQYTWAMLTETTADGWAIEGGGVGAAPGGPFSVLYSGNTGSRTVVIGGENGSVRYGGSLTGAVGNITINGVNGIVRFENVDWSDGATDLLNVHSSLVAGAKVYVLTTNCSGKLSGLKPGYVSNNPWTIHENAYAISVCEAYGDARGVSMHAVGSSQSLIVAPTLGPSLGDIVNGGTIPPTEVRLDGTGKMYLVNPRWSGTPAGSPRVVVGNTAQLFYRGIKASEIQVATGASATAV